MLDIHYYKHIFISFIFIAFNSGINRREWLVMEFLGKTVVVTGAAGGFGEHLARAFVEEGAFVIAVDKQHTTLAKVFGDAHELIKTVHPHPTMSEAVMEAAAAAYDEVIHM